MNRSIALTIYVAIQLAIVLVAADFSFDEAIDLFGYLDSQWYTHISLKGYAEPLFVNDTGSQFAFFPLWPAVLRYSSQALGTSVLILGPLISFLCFVLAIAILSRPSLIGSGTQPSSLAGWLALVFAPGSWVFLSNHTEGLFLLLSVLAIWRAHKLDWFGAAVFAGVSALARNQGLILIGAIAVGALISRGPTSTKSKWAFLFTVIAVSIAALWPVYEWSIVGDPFAHVKAQKYWQVSFSLARYIRNFFWMSTTYLPRTTIFWSGLAISVYLFFKRPEFRCLSLYLGASLLIMPLQGNNFPQAYRFSAVLFPLWFVVGDFGAKLAGYIPSRTVARHASTVVFVCFLLWHIRITTYYFFQTSQWPY